MSDTIWMGTNFFNQRAVANINRAGQVVPTRHIENALENSGGLRDVFEKAGDLATSKELPRLGRLGELAQELRSSFRPDGPVLSTMGFLGKSAGFLSLGFDLVQGGAELNEIAHDPALNEQQRGAQIHQKALEMVVDVSLGTALTTAGAAIGSLGGPAGVVGGVVLASVAKDKIMEGFHDHLERQRILHEPIYG